MKKLLITLAMTAFATSAFAAGATINGDGTTLGGGVFKPSTNVIVSVVSEADAYAAGAKHKLGTKGYGTTSADPVIDDFDCDPTDDTQVTVSNVDEMPGACE